ncbi:formylmethanofuran dehydrogenase subunit C [Faunimonas sp. B44]|uniref:formylmethanofuran dehydrogenase subunit C n=1 Tax=Faunimonas sp. B44 TaxID=3461493 RepID=UPI00404501EE
MTGFVLRLRAEPPQRLDLSPVRLDRMSAMSDGEIARLELQTTRETARLGDLFGIARQDADEIRIEGGSDRLDLVGHGMAAGAILVDGPVGQQVGRAMSGGTIRVLGRAGPLAGSGMTGGRLDISGDAGDRLGGPRPGEMVGMAGGAILVRGGAGERAGDRMRRGLIAIGGDVGGHAGSRMIAGTLVAGGRAGPRPGYLMRRGTLLFGRGADGMSPTFLDTGAHDLVALRLISKTLVALGYQEDLIAGPMRRYMGDTAVLGLGEIFVPA